MDVEDYRSNLLSAVGSIADAEGEFLATAFTQRCTEILTEAGEFDDVVTLDFEGAGTRRRKLKVNGYDLENADNSVALIVTAFSGSTSMGVLSSTDAKNYLKAVQNFLAEARDGSFFEGREESSAAFQLAYDLHNRASNVSRYRIYLLTDDKLSARLRELPTESESGIPVDLHLWDIERFHQLQESQTGREPLLIDLRPWTGDAGLPALEVEATSEVKTYLASVPGALLASLYGKFGSRLLESNVRSYLTNRGKVNKGIRDTVFSSPERFMAFNNGITATATSVQTKHGSSALVMIEDLQIVNGGQTTASLFFVDKESKTKGSLEKVHVPMKLVVVAPELAGDLVPNISRYANSQNAVSAADFFSNSPFHVRIEELSRRILAPAVAGATYDTKWYYERTRGQYENEKNKLPAASAARFDKQYPKHQKFDKPALAKYVMSWEQRPHIVSAGAQKNFVAFADIVAKKWEKDETAFNETYFKESVAKAILFNAIRAHVIKTSWYQEERAYLANIVAYTVAKLANLIDSQGRGRLLNFEEIWRRQAVPDSMLNVGLDLALVVQKILTNEQRPVRNVTEWAKKAECWNTVAAYPYALPVEFIASLADPSVVAESKRNARQTQKIDNGINQQVRLLEIPKEHWTELRDFALSNRVGGPTDLGILDLVTGRRPGLPSERQAARLFALVSAANAKGFKTFSP
ncbi:AIPR family protein [Arthrobacter zhaoguopingii]|uniref:AIPR family protein n=1 Tax=Arthrobacter zhaoguopingii TaxID=2681491 RepID=UPI00135B47E8|nr:AIPR family protein [Arthrobacter zhaoguopingii]